MQEVPIFPHFKPVELEDRDVIHEFIRAYRAETSEWTYTNLFMWRHHYGYRWAVHGDWLLVVSCANGTEPYALSPIGPPSRLAVTRLLLQWLREAHGGVAAIERADRRLVAEIEPVEDLVIEPTREQFDYIYRSEDLILLAGRKYHSKRNHINKFMRSYAVTYQPLRLEHVPACLQLAETWCQWRRCAEDLNLAGEWDAIREALQNLAGLHCNGGVVLLHDQVEAFALGELLNDDSAVVHIEKANPDIPGMYALINQQFCEHCWADVPFVNREQDLDEAGLRKAKMSYYPDHLLEKFRIRLI
jgi:hypothetical protein